MRLPLRMPRRSGSRRGGRGRRSWPGHESLVASALKVCWSVVSAISNGQSAARPPSEACRSLPRERAARKPVSLRRRGAREVLDTQATDPARGAEEDNIDSRSALTGRNTTCRNRIAKTPTSSSLLGAFAGPGLARQPGAIRTGRPAWASTTCETLPNSAEVIARARADRTRSAARRARRRSR